MNISSALYADKLTRYFTNLPEGYSNRGKDVFTRSWKLFSGPGYNRPKTTTTPTFSHDTVLLKTSKGLSIEGWYGKTDSASKGTVILFHGLTVTKSSLLDEANDFRYMGYNVFLIDFRGHGNSAGNITTLGVKEAEEVELAFRYIQSTGEKNIFLYSSSMGAVAVSRALAKHGIKPFGIILEMPFLNLLSFLRRRAEMLGFPSEPFAFLTTFWIGIERGFKGFRHSMNRYMKEIHCPVLL
ncbi:MAG: alpha/beta hydrolase [Chitinophagaceae bacterium]|nr:alpha/beta hydrolase [Chitinophagaceae bacterium]